MQTVKPAETRDGVDSDNELVLRLYEPYGGRGTYKLKFAEIIGVRRVTACNVLEDELCDLALNGNVVALAFKPFEIRTIKIALKK